MKFELMDTGIAASDGYSSLVISASEFLKADEDPDAMHQLIQATEMFAAPNCFDYYMTREQYDAVKQFVRKGSKVVFSFLDDFDYVDNGDWLRVDVITNNKVINVIKE